MSDQAHDYADRKIAEFQAEVWETYQQAQADAQEALSKFLKRFEKEDAKRRKLVEKGEMTKAEYRSWRQGQILRSKQLSSTLDQVSQAMVNANQVAMAALAGKLPEVYAENANYSAFWVCKETGLAVGFDLVDPDTVQHMLTAGEAVLMLPSVNVAKDMAWNRKLVASQLTQGVLLGESIPKMARRVQRVTGSNYATAVRTARTTVTGAENAGRVHSYKRAKEMGIKLEKEWVATLDGRTRHSHRQLDGQKIPNEEGAKFDNGCRYPGDPQGRYDEICNCRCTLVAAIEGVDTSDAERWSKLPEGMTYEEWKNELAPKHVENDTENDKPPELLSFPHTKDDFGGSFIKYKRAKSAWEAEHADEIAARNAEYSRWKVSKYKGFKQSTEKTKAQGVFSSDKAAAGEIEQKLGVSAERAAELQDSVSAWFGNMYKSMRDKKNVTPLVVDKRYDVEQVIAGMPKYDGKIWRGLELPKGQDPRKLWPLGEKMDMKGISSWSSAEDVAREFAVKTDDGVHVIFECAENKTGAAVAELSRMLEYEVLHGERSGFLVKSVKQDGEIWRIEVEEL